MALLKGCELHFAKLDPKRPNARYNKQNPTWELQIRTSSKEQRKEWIAMNLPVKDVIPEEDGALPYSRVNLRKKSITAKAEAASPVNVVGGDLKPLDPNTIGNGSIGNLRIFQYEYPKEGGGIGVASVLMGLQVTKHIVYVPKPREDEFTEEDMETTEPAGNGVVEDEILF
jgi:hypothetical protein